LKDVSFSTVFQHIPYDIERGTVALFLSECYSKCLYHQPANDDFFQQLSNQILLLDAQLCLPEYFHLTALMSLIRQMGLEPHTTADFFHQLDSAIPGNKYAFVPPRVFGFIESATNNGIDVALLNAEERRYLLDALVLFMQLHNMIEVELKSLSVLRAIFHG
jgi:hypothetical protein